MAKTNTTDFYQRPHLTTVTYALGILLFLLPFFDIKCNNVSMARLKGIDMVTGSRPALSAEMQDLQRGFPDQNNNTSATAGGEGKFFLTSLLALTLGVIGVALSLISKGEKQRSVMVMGILAAVALLGSWLQVSAYMQENTGAPGNGQSESQLSSMINVTATPTFWFVLCLLCFLAGAFISYKNSRYASWHSAEKPPESAPQIKIDNPGDQSEFPSAPDGERDLG